MLVSIFKLEVFGLGLLCSDDSYLENDTEYPDCNPWTWNIVTRLMEREVPGSCCVLRQTLINLSSGRTGEGERFICCRNGDCLLGLTSFTN